VDDGDLIPAYIQANRDELARLSSATVGPAAGPMYALVSFTAYLTPDAVAALLATQKGGLATVAAHARVPLLRRQTELITMPAVRLPDDILIAMNQAADRKQRESIRQAQLAEVELDRRAFHLSMADVAAAEAVQYRARCACLYALVVRGTPAALARLALRREVRVVDAAPEVSRVDWAVWVAPLPEQQGRVQPPPDDDLSPPAEGATQTGRRLTTYRPASEVDGAGVANSRAVRSLADGGAWLGARERAQEDKSWRPTPGGAGPPASQLGVGAPSWAAIS